MGSQEAACIYVIVCHYSGSQKDNTHWAFVHHHKPAAAEQLNCGFISRIKPDK